MQFPKNFLRPYGQVDAPMEEKAVLARVSPESCEWFRQPKVAMSELAEAIQKNVALLSEHNKTFNALASLPAMLQPLVEALQPLNTKNAETPVKGNIKNILKLVINDQNDDIIDAAFQIGGTLFHSYPSHSGENFVLPL